MAYQEMLIFIIVLDEHGNRKIKLNEFLAHAARLPVFDVRSPAEYKQAHIPSAFSLPLFDDEERKIVGTAYKQQSREVAIKIGLDIFGPKMRKIVEEVEQIVNKEFNTTPNNGNKTTVLVHCWRGGMRSAGVAWLLDIYGFKVYTLAGGYKAFRQWVMAQFEIEYPLNIIGGYTGSGKTLLLKELTKRGQVTVDLEGIARHKGSAFGDDDASPQPRQEMFENELAMALKNSVEKLQAPNTNGIAKPIWLEDESQRIGQLNIPNALWRTMRAAPVYFIDVPFEERLDYIIKDYGAQEKTKLVNATMRIQKRLGGHDTKMAVNYLLEDNYKEAFRILLRYYDKHYKKSLENRENLTELLHSIPCDKINTTANTQKLLNEKILE